MTALIRDGKLLNDAIYKIWMGSNICACAAWKSKNRIEGSKNA
jgi:hypothetical protein